MASRLERLRRLQDEPGFPVLAPGARGPAVVELKRRLRSWYGARGVRAPRRMRGPFYGPNAVEAVKAFQRASGLKPDGIVGPETWRALPPG
jgi:peptidoglycan hydrolase-like protein with peptidoglycan-binding domain